MLRVGHKGADAIEPGNTIPSFLAAVDAGVDAIEFDVLRPKSDFPDGADWRKAKAGPAEATGPLVVAHDWGAAAKPGVPTFEEVLDAFCEPPLDQVQIDLDIKVAGREDEIVEAVRSRGLLERTMTSGMETPNIRALGEFEPSLRRGWTLPLVRRDWTKIRTLRPFVLAGMLALRMRLPGIVAREAGHLGVRNVWIHHQLATPALADACHEQDLQLIAWTVDDVERMRVLAEMGVDGICSNDPRLFRELQL